MTEKFIEFSPYQTYIYKSRYSRWLEDEKRREDWPETVQRYVDYFSQKYANFPANKIYKAIRNLEVMPSMRALMTAGPALDRDPMAGYNPVSGDTRVVTREYGNVAISKLKGSSATVLNKNGEWVPATFKSYGVQPLTRVILKRNSNSLLTVDCTSNHRWVLTDGHVLDTASLREGDNIPFITAPKPTIDNDYILGVRHGIIYGDGTATKAAERVKGYHIRLCGNNSELLKYFSGYPVSYPPSANGDPVVMLYDDFAATHSLKTLPDPEETEAYLLGFFRGWLAADGSVSGKSSQVSLCARSEGVEWLQNYAERLGFVIQHIREQPRTTNFGNRKYPSYVVMIHRDCITEEDLLCSWKQDKFKDLDSKFVVASIEDLGREAEVFCAEVPDTNTFVLEGGILTGNCSFAAVDDYRVFDEILFILMCGTGVGFSVERQYICNLPVVPDNLTKSNQVITVQDSKEGWAQGFRELIEALYGGSIPTWDLSLLRPAGAPLKTFGGRSSGPEPLDHLMKFTVSVFKKAQGRKLTSIECHDIVCKIASSVVVGGVVGKTFH